MSLKQDLLILTFQQAWHFHFHAAYLYQALSGRTCNKNTRQLLYALSRNAMQHARLDAIGLAVLRGSTPDKKEAAALAPGDILLLSCNARLVMLWLGWLDWVFTHLPLLLNGQKREEPVTRRHQA